MFIANKIPNNEIRGLSVTLL